MLVTLNCLLHSAGASVCCSVLMCIGMRHLEWALLAQLKCPKDRKECLRLRLRVFTVLTNTVYQVFLANAVRINKKISLQGYRRFEEEFLV